jgi:hypothetical protein
MTDLLTNYIINNIQYISCLFFVGIFYNYKNISIKIFIKHYLYFIAFHICINLYKYMEIVIKYILHHTIIALVIISISFLLTYFLRKQ